MSERKPGWYWVHVYGNWEPAYTDDGDVFDHIDSRVDKVGPRIPTPDEPWQAVPVEPTPLMASVAEEHIEAGHDAATIWRAMLMYVPRRESV
jgi:hypothetical protein